MSAFNPAAPEGSISRVKLADDDRRELLAMSAEVLAEHLVQSRIEFNKLADWLMTPPLMATDAEKKETLAFWYEARQGCSIYREIRRLRVEIEGARQEVYAVQADLDALEEERETARSHDEMAMFDQQEDELLEAQEEAEERLRARVWELERFVLAA